MVSLSVEKEVVMVGRGEEDVSVVISKVGETSLSSDRVEKEVLFVVVVWSNMPEK